MRYFFFVLFVLGIYGCSSTDQRKATLREMISAEEVRSLAEIRSHAVVLLDSHPELKDSAKQKIRQQIDHVIERQQSLKEEESKIVNLLIATSLENNSKLPKRDLRKELDQVYDAKEENILSLVNLIAKMRANQETSESFDRDVQMFFREFR